MMQQSMVPSATIKRHDSIGFQGIARNTNTIALNPNNHNIYRRATPRNTGLDRDGQSGNCHSKEVN
eukprot:3930225-Amphidinium_carterae.2